MIGIIGKVYWKKVEAGHSEENGTKVLEHLASARSLKLKAIKQILLRIIKNSAK